MSDPREPTASLPFASMDGARSGTDTEPMPAASVPLAERMRPTRLDDVVGQQAALGAGSFLREAVRTGTVPSVVFWGPPGTGKTTIARCLAASIAGTFVALSAVTSGVKDVRAVVEEAQSRRRAGGRTILFVDEIHRFNKAQQDAFLPHVESGLLVLLGATTENPGFSLTRALLSRLRVVVLTPLDAGALAALIDRALLDPERGLGGRFALEDGARAALLDLASGDARRALQVLETAAGRAIGRAAVSPITLDDIREASQRRVAAYDKGGDLAYDALSAFHKALRGSDADAALYWMARMLEGGEDALVLVRRMLAMSCEDVGLADLHATRIVLEAKQAIEFLGVPEGELALVRAVVYLAAAPKSNAVAKALGAAHEAAKRHPDLPVPLHLRQAPTAFAQSLGHGEAYRYPHDFAGAFVAQDYLPEALAGTRLYQPIEVGDEREVAKRLAYWQRLRDAAAKAKP